MMKGSAIQTVQTHRHTFMCDGCLSKYKRETKFHITILCKGGSYPKKPTSECPCITCLVKVSCNVACKALEDYVDCAVVHEALKKRIQAGKKKESMLWTVIG